MSISHAQNNFTNKEFLYSKGKRSFSRLGKFQFNEAPKILNEFASGNTEVKAHLYWDELWFFQHAKLLFSNDKQVKLTYETDFDLKVKRLKHLLPAETNKEIADFFGITQASFSTRRSRGSFPDEQLINIVKNNPSKWSHLDVNWILTGKKQFDADIEEGVINVEELLSPQGKIIAHRLSKLTEEEQNVILKLIELFENNRKFSKI